MFFEVLSNVRADLHDGLFAGRIFFRGCPSPAGVQRIPWRALVRTRIRAVSMFAEALAYFHFLVPDGPKPINEEVFRSLHPCATDDEITALEVAKIEIIRASDGTVVVLEPGVKRHSLFLGSGRVQGVNALV